MLMLSPKRVSMYHRQLMALSVILQACQLAGVEAKSTSSRKPSSSHIIATAGYTVVFTAEQSTAITGSINETATIAHHAGCLSKSTAGVVCGAVMLSVLVAVLVLCRRVGRQKRNAETKTTNTCKEKSDNDEDEQNGTYADIAAVAAFTTRPIDDAVKGHTSDGEQINYVQLELVRNGAMQRHI
jgi:hypothetical protein